MALSRHDYMALLWTYWLHNFPHLNFNFQTVDKTFQPEDASYQQVGNSLGSMQVGLKEHLERLDEIFSPRGNYTQTLRSMQQMANNIIQQLTAMPDTRKVQVDLTVIMDKTSFIEYYRWLMYLLLMILDLLICPIACLGSSKQSRWLLAVIMVCGVLIPIMSWVSLGAGTATAVGTSDFCVSSDKFINSQTKDSLSAVFDHLPEVFDHHADTGARFAAVFCCNVCHWRLCWASAMTAWRGSCICACPLCWQPVPSVPCCVPSHMPGPSSPSGAIHLHVVSLQCMAPETIDVADVRMVGCPQGQGLW